MDIRFEMEKKLYLRYELQKLCAHMMTRRREIRGKQVHPANEEAKQKIMARYNLDIMEMTGEINMLEDEIYNLQRRQYP